MRIALLTHQWPDARMGGIGTCTRQIAGSLSAAGHEVHVFTLSLPIGAGESVPPGVVLHPVSDLAEAVHERQVPAALASAIHAGGEGVYRLAIGWRLVSALLDVHRHSPFDIVEAPEVEALGLPLALSADFEVPVVTHLHCCTAIARAANEANVDEDARLVAALEFAAIHLADGLCAPTRAVVDATARFVSLPSAVRIIPHPFACDPGPFVAPPVGGPMLFVGRIERLKGVEIVVEALNQFLPRHPQATFRFIGPDTSTADGARSMRQTLEAKLPADLRPRVRFLGEVPPARVAAEWRQCSFGVMPSLRENFSMACCEGMAAGRTQIVGEGTGSVELIGDAGLVADRGSAASLCREMERLWTDRTELDRLSLAAHRRIREAFAPQKVAGVREQFYRDTIDAFRHRGASERLSKLSSLPPDCAAAILPALVRMTGTLAGATGSGGRTPGSRLLRIMDGMNECDGRPAEVLLYGAGKHTARLLSERHLWESRRHRVVGIIDDHPRFEHSPVYLDLPVQSVQAARDRLLAGQNLPPVVLSTDTYEDQFWTQSAPLREAGVRVFRLYS